MEEKMNRVDYYNCLCGSKWEMEEASHWSNEMLEKEGCPDCLSECERCGELKDHEGFIEHCL